MDKLFYHTEVWKKSVLHERFSLRTNGRGEDAELSDIDVMIPVFLPEEQRKSISDRGSDLALEYMMKYGADISPVITNTDHFHYWMDKLPYYSVY